MAVKSTFFLDAFYPSFGADLIIAFLGALMGLAFAYWIYWLSVRQIRRDRLRYVANLIGKIIPSVLMQSGYCKEYAALITANPWSNSNLKLEANSDPKRLADKVDQEGVYHSLLSKYGRSEATYKAFGELYGYIDYIDHLFDDLIATNQRILSATWERKKQYQLTFKKAKETIQSFSLTADLIATQPVLVKHAASLLAAFSNNPASGENITQSFKNVVSPMMDYIIANAQSHPKITELGFLLLSLSDDYFGIELAAKHNAGDYSDIAIQLENAVNGLSTSSKELRGEFSFAEA